MIVLVFILLLVAFGAVNFVLGMLLAAQFGMGPLRRARTTRFLASPALEPPAFLMGTKLSLAFRKANVETPQSSSDTAAELSE